MAKMKPRLRIFISENCSGCNEALDIAADIKKSHSDSIDIEIIDITDSQAVVPEAVFAIPTFMLNNQIVSLGNPGPEDVAGWVADISDAAVIQPET